MTFPLDTEPVILNGEMYFALFNAINGRISFLKSQLEGGLSDDLRPWYQEELSVAQLAQDWLIQDHDRGWIP